MNNDKYNNIDDEDLLYEESDDDEESEGEVPSSDYSDYSDEYNDVDDEIEESDVLYNRRRFNKQNNKKEKNDKQVDNNKQGNIQNNSFNLRNRLNQKDDLDTQNKLKGRKEKTLNNLNNQNGQVIQSNNKKKPALSKKGKVGEQTKDKAKVATKDKAKKTAKAVGKKVKEKAAQTLAGIFKALSANPYFWAVVAILVVSVILIILVVVLYAAFKHNADNHDSSPSEGTQVCTYNVNNVEMSNIKVKLLECDSSGYIDGEELVDFDKYILGVVYAENGAAPTEALKTQAIAAKSYVLNRPSVMGGKIKIEEEDGQYVLSIRNCTNDQVYCDPDRGCWSNSKTAGATVHSGYDSSKAYSKPALSQDSEIRTAVAEVSDKILVDSSGNPFGASFNSSTQITWNNAANSGKKYSTILSDTYPNATLSTATCKVVGGSGGNCNTSTPIKLSEGEDYVVTSTFGYRNSPTAGASTYHQGVDLSATTGTPVYSIFDGTVKVSTDNYSSAGKAILVAHDIDGDGKTDYTSQYYHLSKRDVNVGDTVTGGQKIGEVGSTGVSTGPHLHFGLQDADGTHIDPLPTLKALKSKTSTFDTAEVCNNVTTQDSGGTFSGNFPYYNQCTGTWSSKLICDSADYVNGRCVSSNTICSSGCGYTSFSMIASGLNNDSSINPSNTVDFVSKYSSNSGGGAVTDSALINENVLNNYNLKAEVLFPRGSSDSIDTKKNKIVSALQSGKAVELLVPGHFVALVGIDSNKKITLHDPGKVENVGTYTIDELLNLFKVQRSSKCSGCSDSQFFQYAIAYRKKFGGET